LKGKAKLTGKTSCAVSETIYNALLAYLLQREWDAIIIKREKLINDDLK
jgi:hypothetical protein